MWPFQGVCNRALGLRAATTPLCSTPSYVEFVTSGSLAYTILYYTILYYTILYYTILYYTILYYTDSPEHSFCGSLFPLARKSQAWGPAHETFEAELIGLMRLMIEILYVLMYQTMPKPYGNFGSTVYMMSCGIYIYIYIYIYIS